MESRTIIHARDMAIGYDDNIVASDINLRVERGRITVVLGQSGCGKSTLLKTLIGLIPPIQGQLDFDGLAVDFLSEESLRRLYSRIGVLYQNGALLNSLNLFENVALPITMHYPGIAREIVLEMVVNRLRQVGLSGDLERYPSELSGGMRKRAALARAMILDPEVILCDEPSAGLDPITATGLDELMIDLKELLDVTFVVVTHELRSIERIADDVVVIHDGKIRFNGPYHQLQITTDSFVKAFFLRDEAKKREENLS